MQKDDTRCFCLQAFISSNEGSQVGIVLWIESKWDDVLGKFPEMRNVYLARLIK